MDLVDSELKKATTAMANVVDSAKTAAQEVVGNKADKSILIPYTLLYGQWVGDSAPYTYTIPVAALTDASQKVNVYEQFGQDVASIEQFQKSNIRAWSKSVGQIQLAAYGDLPEMDLDIFIEIGGTYK